MKPRRYVRVGQVFGRLETVSKVTTSKGQRWICKCACGKECVVQGHSLNIGETRSCGCLRVDVSRERSTKHGGRRTKLYEVWAAMLQRCSNPNVPRNRDWHGKGIRVCVEWHEFAPFRQWAQTNGYREGLQIDRIDNDGHYTHENCRWVTGSVNCNNKGNNVRVTAFGETKTLTEWSRDSRCIVCVSAFRGRIDLGWNPTMALTTPSNRKAVA